MNNSSSYTIINMSIDDFLDEVAQYHTFQTRYQQTRTQFAEDCMSEIQVCLRANGLAKEFIDMPEVDQIMLNERYLRLCTNIYDTLEHFMRHYSKTERISFQIVPEESWNRDNIDVRTLIGTFADYYSQLVPRIGADSNNAAKEYAQLSMRTKACYKDIHKILKKKSFEYFPAIIDLPALGLRELDFILFEETHGFLE